MPPVSLPRLMRSLIFRLTAGRRQRLEIEVQQTARRRAQQILEDQKNAAPDIDWTLAPPEAVAWTYDARAGVGRWLNGKSRISEFGIIWESMPAPTFGVTRNGPHIPITPEGIAERGEALALLKAQAQQENLDRLLPDEATNKPTVKQRF